MTIEQQYTSEKVVIIEKDIKNRQVKPHTTDPSIVPTKWNIKPVSPELDKIESLRYIHTVLSHSDRDKCGKS